MNFRLQETASTHAKYYGSVTQKTAPESALADPVNRRLNRMSLPAAAALALAALLGGVLPAGAGATDSQTTAHTAAHTVGRGLSAGWEATFEADGTQTAYFPFSGTAVTFVSGNFTFTGLRGGSALPSAIILATPTGVTPQAGTVYSTQAGAYGIAAGCTGEFTFSELAMSGSVVDSAGVLFDFLCTGVAYQGALAYHLPNTPGAGYYRYDRFGDLVGSGNNDYLTYLGNLGRVQLNAPVVGMATTPDGGGYWMVAADGGVFAFGDAGFYGSTGNIHLNEPVIGMAATPDGKGYWFVAADGGIFSFGDAKFYGSAGNDTLNSPVVGMAATPDGGGYWLVTRTAAVFAFGDAHLPIANNGLIEPIVGIAAGPDDHSGYLVGAAGAVYTFGDAVFHGSMAGQPLNAPIVGMAVTPDGQGYWEVGADGGIFSFGSARYFAPVSVPHGDMYIFEPIVGMAVSS